MDKESVENALWNFSYEELDYTILRKRHLAEDHPVECNKTDAERQASRVSLFCRLQVWQRKRDMKISRKLLWMWKG